MATNPRDQPELEAGRAAVRDGRAGIDPAHPGGALPDATFPELVGRLINGVSDLADRQIDLAKQEISEAKVEATGAATTIAIGAGMGLMAAIFLIIWFWTAVIWFFNWLGAFITVGPVTFAWLGWVVGMLIPVALAFVGYRWFIRVGIARASIIWPPLARTRATLREDLEWLRLQRTRILR
jgi:hypothetical protein